MEMDVKEYEVIFNVDDNISFNCKKCGGCCGNNRIMITYQEINDINEYLEKNIDSSIIEDLAWEWAAFKGRHDLVGLPDVLKEFKERILNYYSLCSIIRKEKYFVPPFYILNRSQNICPFILPISTECAIYPVRPLICQEFPFLIDFSLNEKIIVVSLNQEISINTCGLSDKITNKDTPKERNIHLRDIALKHLKYHILHNQAFLSSLKKRGINTPNLFPDISKEELLHPKTLLELEESMQHINAEKECIIEDLRKDTSLFVDIFQEDGHIIRKNPFNIIEYLIN